MIDHRDAETRRRLLQEELTERVIAARIEVHRALGPGLPESNYEKCFCHQFHPRGIRFDRQVPLPVEYKGIKLDCGYRFNLLVEDVLASDDQLRLSRGEEALVTKNGVANEN